MARVGLKRRAKVVPKSNFLSSGELSATVAQRLKQAYLTQDRSPQVYKTNATIHTCGLSLKKNIMKP